MESYEQKIRSENIQQPAGVADPARGCHFNGARGGGYFHIAFFLALNVPGPQRGRRRKAGNTMANGRRFHIGLIIDNCRMDNNPENFTFINCSGILIWIPDTGTACFTTRKLWRALNGRS